MPDDRLIAALDVPNAVAGLALAERLGATPDDAAARPETAPDCLVYRHWGPA